MFNVKQARRLYAYVEDYNLSSQRLCSRLGMRQEGCFKEFVSFITDEGEERYENTFVYALLKKNLNQRVKLRFKYLSEYVSFGCAI